MLLRNERFQDYYSNQQDIHFCIFSIIMYDMVDANNGKKLMIKNYSLTLAKPSINQ